MYMYAFPSLFILWKNVLFRYHPDCILLYQQLMYKVSSCTDQQFGQSPCVDRSECEDVAAADGISIPRD